MSPAAHSPEDERRQFVRLDMRLMVSYAIVGANRRGKSLTKNVGGGGIRLIAEQPLEVGTRLEIILSVPDRPEPIRCLGEVVWSAPVAPARSGQLLSETEVGIRFLELDSKDRALIMQYAMLYPPVS